MSVEARRAEMLLRSFEMHMQEEVHNYNNLLSKICNLYV